MECTAMKGKVQGADCDQQAQHLRGGALLIKRGIYPEDIKRRQAQIVCPIITWTKYGGMWIPEIIGALSNIIEFNLFI
jgi:hypothetical protein